MADSPFDPIELPEYRPWRRTLIFVAAFVLSAAGALAYVYTRPAEYRAAILMDIRPARAMAEGPGKSVSGEAQVLTSRPVVQDAIQRLGRAGAIPDLGNDPAGVAQNLLRARVADQPNVVQLSADGRSQLFLERLLNMVAESYRDGAARRYEQQIAREDHDLRAEVQNLQDRSAGARARLEEFRDANPTIPAQADRPPSMDIENLKHVYAASTNDVAKSRAWLQSLNRKIDAASVFGGEKPDPAGQAAAIVAAVQQLQSTQARVTRLREAMAVKQKEADDIAVLIGDYNMLQDDLAQAETSEQTAVALLTNLPASQRERAPVVSILQPALSGASPVRPDYTQNAWIAVAGSLLFGFAAVRCARFFAPPPAIVFDNAPVHMQCWDGTPALTYRPQTSQPVAIKLLPPPDPSLAA
jgi:uncharacterized protein involved in exopolysaccharide biosynthesis